MGDQDDVVAWVRERFDDPTYDRDARVLEHIARDPGFAGVVKEIRLLRLQRAANDATMIRPL